MKLRVTPEQLFSKIHQIANRYDLMKFVVQRIVEENEIPTWERDRSTFNPAARALREEGRKADADFMFQQIHRLCDALNFAEHYAVGRPTAQSLRPVAQHWRTEAGSQPPGMVEETVRVCRRYIDCALELLEQIERKGRAGRDDVYHWEPRVYPR